MKKRIVLILLSLFMMILSSSCRKAAGTLSPSSPHEGSVESEAPSSPGSRVLTNIYRSQVFPLPEGETMDIFVLPEWDGEVLRYVSVRYIHEKDADGNESVSRIWSFVESDAKQIVSKKELDFDRPGIPCGVIHGGELIAFLQQSKNGQLLDGSLFCQKLTGGEPEASDSLKEYFADQGSIKSIALDRNGCIYAASDYRIVVFDHSFHYRATIDSQNGEIRVVSGADGSVIAFDGSCVFRIDPDSFEAGPELPFDAYAIAGGALGFDFLTVREDGVWGVLADWESGTAEEHLVYDYAASDRTGQNEFFLCPAQDLGFICCTEEFMPTGLLSAPVLALPVQNVDLSQAAVLKIAATALPSEVINTAVSAFNRNHTDVQLEVAEYRGGEAESEDNRLAREIITGTFMPDIVIGASDSVAVRQMAEKKLYADLTPYLGADSLVNRDNLFDSAERIFDDGQGGMWGITTNILLKPTIASTPSLLGGISSRGYWTLPEFLDYAENLPADTELLHGFTRDKASNLLFGADGYAFFIDTENGTCSFDSPDFIRCLRFLRSLPTEEEYRRTEWGEMDADTIMERRMHEKIALVRVAPDAIGHTPVLAHGTKEWVLIGYPAPEKRNGAGVPVMLGQVFVISSSCQNKEAAWEFIRSCFTDKDGQGGSPALKSLFRSMAETKYDYEFLDFFSFHAETGYGIIQKRDPDHPVTGSDLPYPGIVSDYTPEDAAKMEAILDSVGMPLLSVWKTDVREIIGEELSAFLAGVGTPEDCAAKIQSRVSIWLAEKR